MTRITREKPCKTIEFALVREDSCNLWRNLKMDFHVKFCEIRAIRAIRVKTSFYQTSLLLPDFAQMLQNRPRIFFVHLHIGHFHQIGLQHTLDRIIFFNHRFGV